MNSEFKDIGQEILTLPEEPLLVYIASNPKLKRIELNLFDEILLVGSGKGIVQIKSIPQQKWKNKSSIIFNELHDLYNSYIKNYIAI